MNIFDLPPVPEGRRPNRFYREVARKAGRCLAVVEKFLGDAGEWSNFIVGFADELGVDWQEAVKACHSCQDTDQARPLYEFVWRRVGAEQVVALDAAGNVVGRCLVNVEKMTHAPTYGPAHFILDARLAMAGFVKGELAPMATLVEAVEEARLSGIAHEVEGSKNQTSCSVRISPEELDRIAETPWGKIRVLLHVRWPASDADPRARETWNRVLSVVSTKAKRNANRFGYVEWFEMIPTHWVGVNSTLYDDETKEFVPMCGALELADWCPGLPKGVYVCWHEGYDRDEPKLSYFDDRTFEDITPVVR